MPAFVFAILAGIACIILGISNMRGNISTVHAYHRKRVSEEDRLPFGQKIGLGTVIIGIGIILFGILSMITLYTEKQVFLWIGVGVLAAGFIAGMGFSFYAMIKYNKGIF